jgi:hypothetical protein
MIASGRTRLVALALAVGLVLAPGGKHVSAAGGSVAATVQVAAVTVDLALSTSDTRVGEMLQARAIVTNAGSGVVGPISVELRVDHEGIALRGAPARALAQVKPGKNGVVLWAICGRVPGSYLLLVRATVDGTAIDSPARLLTITDGTRACPRR